eukprot:gene4306-4876_t
MPLKSFQDLLAAVKYMLENGLSLYVAKFFLPFVGDWPTQFYIRQLVYSDTFFFSGQSNIIPFIGPLHISLNSRETVVLKFHSVFKELYSFRFGEKAFLAKKPKAWRQSLLLEVLYGGWSLVTGSSRTKPTDSVENIFLKARGIDASKHELHEFKSWFVPPRKYSFSPGKIKVLKLKAAKFLVQKLAILRNSAQEGKMIPRMSRQRKTVSKWKLPNIFQESVVSNQVLPLAYNNPACSPCSTKKCDKSGCSVVSSIWRIIQCGHSFHVECNLSAVSECHICKAQIIKLIEDLSAKANTAVFNRGTDDDDPQEQEEQTQQSDVGDNFEFLDAGDVEVQAVFTLMEEISSWSRPSSSAF